MKYSDYQGHKVFCNCNASFKRDVLFKKLAPCLDFDFPDEGDADCKCPDCGLSPWYYLDVKYEPKESVKP
jgi:hypothetical protein